MKKIFILRDDKVKSLAIEAVKTAPVDFKVTISEPSRSLDQNALQWPIFHAFGEQKQWLVNGHLCKMSPEEWKDVLSAAYKNETRMASGILGGVVILGMRTSKMTKPEFSDWIEFLKATAAQMKIDIDYDL